MASPGERTRSGHLLGVVVSSTFVVSLSSSVLGVAVPVIVRHFHASAFQATLIVLMPSLASTALLLGLGRIGDLVGRRLSYLVGLAVFTAASFLLGLAPNAWALVVLEILEGAGVATLWANSAAVIVVGLRRDRLQHGLGIYIASISVAQMVGPAVGGIIAEGAGWRWIFWLNVPVGVALALWGRRALAGLPDRRQPLRLDLVGMTLVVVGLSGLIVSLSLAESLGWSSPLVGGGVAISVLVLATFVAAERRVRHPLFDPELFKERAFTLTIFSGVLNAMATWGPALLMVLFFQAVRGDSPFVAGLAVLPLPVATGVCSAAAGWLARFGTPRTLMVAGSAVAVAGLGVLAVALSGSYLLIDAALAVVGIGSGVYSPANANALLAGAPPGQAGLVNGGRLATQNVGYVMSTAVALTIVVAQLPQRLRHEFFAGTISRVAGRAVEDLVVGYRYAIFLLALFAVAGWATALLIPTRPAATVSAGR
jgi:MFS family permease